MCGIGAIFDPAGTGTPEAAQRMATALRHRGPDGEAVRRLGPATLAFRRLAIIDVAGGDQPLDSEDGTCSAIVNGEIYNHMELREELGAQGHTFATRSDCEVVVHAYEQHGTDCVRRLNGMFAFALWDGRAGRLVVARDHFGVKPLYWWTDGRKVAVASEVGALIAAGLVRPALDPVALDHFLAYRFVPAPRTLFAGVSKLPPAGMLVADASGTSVTSYREPPGAALAGSREELARELRDRFVDAVERQMMSDVPYGAFLSGGIDSAAVAAAMKLRAPAPPETFTIGFPGYAASLDEREAAAATAAAVGTHHHSTEMVEADFLPELERYVHRLEEPCGITSTPALLALSRFAAGSVKVVLSGQGADEPHGGYGHHRAAAAIGALGRVPGPLASPLRGASGALSRNERAARLARLVGPMPDVDRLLRLTEVTDPGLRQRLTGRALEEEAEGERREIAGRIVADVGDRGPLEQALYLDTHMVLPDRLLVCGDKMSMAVGLEQRVPFLDRELMRFVERIPVGMRAGVRRGKRAHRRAVRPLVPAATLERPKHGFSTPYDDWFKRSLGDEVARRFEPGSKLSTIVDPATVATLAAEHRSGRADRKAILFCLMELSEWHRTFIEGAVEAPLASMTGSS